jgi:hypothetical protein
MKITLKEQIKLSLPACQKAQREVWLGQFPAQAILIAD